MPDEGVTCAGILRQDGPTCGDGWKEFTRRWTIRVIE